MTTISTSVDSMGRFPVPRLGLLAGKRSPELARLAAAMGVAVNPVSSIHARLSAEIKAATAAQLALMSAFNQANVKAQQALEAARIAASKPVPAQVEADIKAMGLKPHEAAQVRAMVAPPTPVAKAPIAIRRGKKGKNRGVKTTPAPAPKPVVVAVATPVVTPPVVVKPAELPVSAIEPLNAADVAVLDELQDAKAQWKAWAEHADLMEARVTELLGLLAHADDVIRELKGRMALRDDHVQDLVGRVNAAEVVVAAHSEDKTLRMDAQGRWRSALTGRFAKRSA
jgi:ribosomal protein L16/L10AE